jgi:hypothetical protein
MNFIPKDAIKKVAVIGAGASGYVEIRNKHCILIVY